LRSDQVKPWLDVKVPVWEGPEPYFKIPEECAKYIPGKKQPYRVVPDDKSYPVHALAESHDSMVAVYPEAISVSTPGGQRYRFEGWAAFTIAIGGVLAAVHTLIFLSYDNVGRVNLPVIVIALVSGPIFALCARWMYRLLEHTPPERPILFNRKTRQVHYFVPHNPPFWKFWKPIPTELRSHGWDDMRLRCYKTHHATGVTVREVFNLLMLWGQEDGDPQVLDDFGAVGFVDTYSDAKIFSLWEHIRRYMEEGGPPIPPGEKLRKPGNKNKPLEFPPDILAAAGGPPLSREEVERLAGTASA